MENKLLNIKFIHIYINHGLLSQKKKKKINFYFYFYLKNYLFYIITIHNATKKKEGRS